MARSSDVPRSRRAPELDAAPPRRALVTGASGFIGRHLCRHLIAEGWEVSVVARATSQLPVDIGSRCRVIDADMCFEEFAAAVFAARPEVCFHLATHFSNGHDAADIDVLVDSNIIFGSRLLEALTRCGHPRVVYAGSRMQHFAGDPFRPVSLYAATKQAFGDVLRFYADVQGLPAVTLELPDTYGPDDPRRKLLTLLGEAAASGEPLLMSPGDQLVEVLHVRDVVSAFSRSVTLADRAAPSFSAAGEVLPLRQFVREVEEATGRRVPVRWGAKPYRDREMMTPWLHWPVLPGWVPRVGLQEGLRSVLGSTSVLSTT